MTAQQTEPAPIANEAVESAVEFRVSRPGMPRRRLRLVGSRYVFGSGPDCSVRLDDASVRTTHAVLTRDAERVLLRAYGTPISVNGQSATEAALDLGDHFQLGQYDFELIAAPLPLDLPESETRRDSADSTASAARSPSGTAPSEADAPASDAPESSAPESCDRDLRVAEANGTETAETPGPRRRVAFADSMRIVRESVTARAGFAAEGKVATPLAPSGRSEAQEVIDQLARLAHERRQQERSRRQIARYRRREERQRKQIEALRAAQDAAEQRARRAEESVHEVRGQLDALADRVTMIAKTAMPDIEDRLHQQHQESLVFTRQSNEVIEALRQRLDAVQDAVDAVQGETREIRQQTASVREDQQEVLSNAEQLEQMIQVLSESREADRAGQASELDEMRESLREISLKLAHTSSQLDETRQSSQGLSALVQQLRASLLNMQTDSQRFATIERIDTVERQLRVTDVRLNELCQEYDAQTVQLQQECETLRQRLEDVEERASELTAGASTPSDLPDTTGDASHDAIEESSSHASRLDQPQPSQWKTEPPEMTVEADEPDAATETAASAEPAAAEQVEQVEHLHDVETPPAWENAEKWNSSDPWEESEEWTSSEESAAPVHGEPEEAESEWSSPLAADYRSTSPWEVAASDGADDSSEDEDESMTYAPTQQFDPAAQLDPEQAFAPEPAFAPEQAFAPEPAFDPEADREAEQTFRLDPTAEIDRERDQDFSSEVPFGSTAPLTLGETDQDNSQPFASSSPTGGRSAAEILASMGLSCEEENQDSADDSQLAAPLSSSEPPTHGLGDATSAIGPSADSVGEDEGDDDSIEAYMNRLLKRVQGGTVVGPTSANAPADSKPVTHTVEPAPAPKRETEPVAPAVSAAAEQGSALENTPYVPRSQAPERTSGLAAMRELANNSARLAIAQSVRQRMVHEKMFKFSLFAMGLLAGFAALVGSGFQMDRWFIVACCCFGLSIFFLIEGLSLARRLRRADATAPPAE